MEFYLKKFCERNIFLFNKYVSESLFFFFFKKYRKAKRQRTRTFDLNENFTFIDDIINSEIGIIFITHDI